MAKYSKFIPALFALLVSIGNVLVLDNYAFAFLWLAIGVIDFRFPDRKMGDFMFIISLVGAFGCIAVSALQSYYGNLSESLLSFAMGYYWLSSILERREPAKQTN